MQLTETGYKGRSFFCSIFVWTMTRYINIFNLLLFFGCSHVANSQVTVLSKKNCNRKADSLLIKRCIDSLNKVNGNDPSSMYDSGKFYYAPGNYFKILTIDGEGCGAYCNPMYESWIFYEKAGKLTRESIGMDPVTGIFLLDKKNNEIDFLVFTETWARPRGTETGTQKTAYHMRLNDSISWIFAKNKNDLKRRFDALFSVYSGVLCSEHEKAGAVLPELEFDETTKNITYHYFEFVDELNKCYEVKGILKYQNRVFYNKVLVDKRPKEE
jgi:hypothetical protein